MVLLITPFVGPAWCSYQSQDHPGGSFACLASPGRKKGRRAGKAKARSKAKQRQAAALLALQGADADSGEEGENGVQGVEGKEGQRSRADSVLHRSNNEDGEASADTEVPAVGVNVEGGDCNGVEDEGKHLAVALEGKEEGVEESGVSYGVAALGGMLVSAARRVVFSDGNGEKAAAGSAGTAAGAGKASIGHVDAASGTVSLAAYSSSEEQVYASAHVPSVLLFS